MDRAAAEAIAGRIKGARERAGMSQLRLSIEMGLARPAISEMERGNRRVTGEELIRLGRSLGVDPRWLLMGDG